MPLDQVSTPHHHSVHHGHGFINDTSSALKSFVHDSEELIGLLGALIMIVGVVIAIFNSARAIYNDVSGSKLPMILGFTGKKSHTATFSRVRLQLGIITALGLEVLVVSDVLETVVKSADEFTFEALGKIGVIAVFRTGLAFMLGREVKEIKEEVEEEEEGGEDKHHVVEGAKKHHE